jgi:hypothetical protein
MKGYRLEGLRFEGLRFEVCDFDLGALRSPAFSARRLCLFVEARQRSYFQAALCSAHSQGRGRLSANRLPPGAGEQRITRQQFVFLPVLG